MNVVLKISEIDNVATCLKAVKKGEKIPFEGVEIVAGSDIPEFHKIAIKDIKKGEIVYKYGQVIGDALEDIKTGDYVHVHNVESTRGRGDKGEK